MNHLEQTNPPYRTTADSVTSPFSRITSPKCAVPTPTPFRSFKRKQGNNCYSRHFRRYTGQSWVERERDISLEKLLGKRLAILNDKMLNADFVDAMRRLAPFLDLVVDGRFRSSFAHCSRAEMAETAYMLQSALVTELTAHDEQ